MALAIHTMILKRDIDGDHKSGVETHATNTTTITANGGASATTTTTVKMGSRRIFTPQFKIQVLDSYRNDDDCKGNQRATARKYGIHRRQIQKWLQCEINLRSSIVNNYTNTNKPTTTTIEVPTTTTQPSLLPSSSSLTTTSLNGSATVIECDVINVKSNTNKNVHNTTTTTTPLAHQYTTTDTNLLSLDISRHSVALSDNNSNSSNKYKTICPILSPSIAYAPVSFMNQHHRHHRTLSPSTGLPCSPIFSASNDHQATHQQQQQQSFKIRDTSSSSSTAAILYINNDHQNFYENSSAIVADNNNYMCNNYDYDLINDSLYSPAIATPIDLTINNRNNNNKDDATILSSLSTNPCTTCLWQNNNSDIHYIELSNSNNKAWDLSLNRKRKHSNDINVSDIDDNDASSIIDVKPSKIVKLFKPYLPSNHDDDDYDNGSINDNDKKFAKHEDPIIWSNFTANSSPSCYVDDYNNNNNNHIFENYNSLQYHNNNNYQYYNSTTSLHHQHLSSLSPVSGYESATSSSYGSSSECGEIIGTCPLNNNNCTYEMNFKIQLIDNHTNHHNDSNYHRGILCNCAAS